MTDIEIAKESLRGNTIALCRGGKIITDKRHGIAPMLSFLSEGRDLSGFSVADLIVGKAAALLFVKAGIVSVYAKVLSRAGQRVLECFSIPYTYERLTEKIINRKGDDICPMERATLLINSPDEALSVLLETQKNLLQKRQ